MMARVDHGDLPDNVLAIDALSAYAGYEFRARLHGVASAGGAAIDGPTTGVLLTGGAPNDAELTAAPSAEPTSSASVRIGLPHYNLCRSKLEVEVWHTNDGVVNGWAQLGAEAARRSLPNGAGFEALRLRCPARAASVSCTPTSTAGKRRRPPRARPSRRRRCRPPTPRRAASSSASAARPGVGGDPASDAAVRAAADAAGGYPRLRRRRRRRRPPPRRSRHRGARAPRVRADRAAPQRAEAAAVEIGGGGGDDVDGGTPVGRLIWLMKNNAARSTRARRSARSTSTSG